MSIIIDLRSDTLTKPNNQMYEAMMQAEVGDDGRGEDPTVQELERLAATISGKDAAIFCNSGTMANILAVLAYCKRKDKVAVHRLSHLYQSEQSIFLDEYFGRKASFYEVNENGTPNMTSVRSAVKDAQMLSLENSVGFAGGSCLSPNTMDQIANHVSVPIHVDGARIFNVAAYFEIPVEKLINKANSIQFCLSKGLGAPVGSLLCGDQIFIDRARNIRKMIGGDMRQSGVVAAAGIVALLQAMETVKIDNYHTQLLAKQIEPNEFFHIQTEMIQTNIILLDVSKTNEHAEQVVANLRENGLYGRAVSDNTIRFVVYRDITKEMISKAAKIINQYFAKFINATS